MTFVISYGMYSWNSATVLSAQKTRMIDLSEDKRSLTILYAAVYTQYQRVTSGRTNERTDGFIVAR